MSKLSPKDDSNDLKITLTNGEQIKARIRDDDGNEKRGRIICSRHCPFMCAQEWEASIDRHVIVYSCALFNQTFPYLMGIGRSNYYHLVRNPSCLTSDPEISEIDPKILAEARWEYYEKNSDRIDRHLIRPTT